MKKITIVLCFLLMLSTMIIFASCDEDDNTTTEETTQEVITEMDTEVDTELESIPADNSESAIDIVMNFLSGKSDNSEETETGEVEFENSFTISSLMSEEQLASFKDYLSKAQIEASFTDLEGSFEYIALKDGVLVTTEKKNDKISEEVYLKLDPDLAYIAYAQLSDGSYTGGKYLLEVENLLNTVTNVGNEANIDMSVINKLEFAELKRENFKYNQETGLIELDQQVIKDMLISVLVGAAGVEDEAMIEAVKAYMVTLFKDLKILIEFSTDSDTVSGIHVSVRNEIQQDVELGSRLHFEAYVNFEDGKLVSTSIHACELDDKFKDGKVVLSGVMKLNYIGDVFAGVDMIVTQNNVTSHKVNAQTTEVFVDVKEIEQTTKLHLDLGALSVYGKTVFSFSDTSVLTNKYTEVYTPLGYTSGSEPIRTIEGEVTDEERNHSETVFNIKTNDKATGYIGSYYEFKQGTTKTETTFIVNMYCENLPEIPEDVKAIFDGEADGKLDDIDISEITD